MSLPGNSNITTQEWKALIEERRQRLDVGSKRVIRKINLRRKKEEARMRFQQVLLSLSFILILLIASGILPREYQ